MRHRWLLRALFALQVVVAALILTYCVASGGRLIVTHLWVGLFFTVASAVCVVVPISIIRKGNKTEYSAQTLFVVASALALPTQAGVVALAAGMPIGWAIRRQLHAHRLQDSCGDVIAFFAALSVAHMIGGVGMAPRDVAGAVVGGMIGDPVTLLFVAASYWCAQSFKFWKFVASCLIPVLPVLLLLTCNGVLVGALANANSWALPLCAAPLGLIFLAYKARVEASEDRARLDGLLTAATSILRGSTIVSVIDAATEAAAHVFTGQSARIDTEPARQDELGAAFVAEGIGKFHLVVGTRGELMNHFTDQDHRLVETLASITASALSKAAQHEDTTIQARLDPLTGLANRRSFEEQVGVAMKGMRSSDGIGIIFADLDGFKSVNDTHGHQVGDEILVETARRLSRAVRGADLVARLGGDEFTVLLRGVHTADEAAPVAKRILAAIREPYMLDGGIEFHTTSSIGIALASDVVGAGAADLLTAADEAMYEAKRAGKDCWRVAPSAVALPASLAMAD
jgi:diguanylate cyclase (GGDEF)-like protein